MDVVVFLAHTRRQDIESGLMKVAPLKKSLKEIMQLLLRNAHKEK